MRNVPKPSVTVIVADGVDSAVAGHTYQTLYPPSYGLDFVGIRHNNSINILWGDSHVAWMSRTELLTGKNGDQSYYYKKDK